MSHRPPGGSSTSHYLQKTYDAALNFWSTDSNFTLSCRFRVEKIDLSNNRYLYSADGGGGLPWFINLTAAQVIQANFVQQTLATRTATGTTKIQPHKDYHVCVIGVPSTRFDVYLNGRWEAGQTFTGTLRDEATTAIRLGGSQNNNLSFQGDVSEFGYWLRALTLAEMRSLAAGTPLRMFNPKAAWLCEDNDHLFADSSGGGFHLTSAGTPQKGRIVHPPIDLRPMSFDPKRAAFITISAPTCTLDPTIGWTPEVGQTLSVTHDGTWTGSPTFTYQWQYNDGTWNDIVGATSNSWVVDVSGLVDVGDSIRCVVTGTNGGGSANANSNTLGPVTQLSLSGHRAVVALG